MLSRTAASRSFESSSISPFFTMRRLLIAHQNTSCLIFVAPLEVNRSSGRYPCHYNSRYCNPIYQCQNIISHGSHDHPTWQMFDRRDVVLRPVLPDAASYAYVAHAYSTAALTAPRGRPGSNATKKYRRRATIQFASTIGTVRTCQCCFRRDLLRNAVS